MVFCPITYLSVSSSVPKLVDSGDIPLIEGPNQTRLTEEFVIVKLCSSCLLDISQGEITEVGLLVCVRKDKDCPGKENTRRPKRWSWSLQFQREGEMGSDGEREGERRRERDRDKGERGREREGERERGRVTSSLIICVQKSVS